MPRWFQAVSESSEDELVFRPEGHPLPPARGRLVLELAEDGSFSATAPGPVDAPVPTALAGWEVAAQEPERLVLRRGTQV